MNVQAIEALYEFYRTAGMPISAHLPALRRLATGCQHATEFGVKKGASTTALLLGCGNVTSYDTVSTFQALDLASFAGPAWRYRVADSRAAIQDETDLLFIDSLHTYDQCKAELARMGSYVRQWMIFHDTITFGCIGAEGETGRQAPGVRGIRLAIDEYMASHWEWAIYSHDAESHGLLVLRRRE